MSFLAAIVFIGWFAVYCVFRDWKMRGFPKAEDRGTDIMIIFGVIVATAYYIWNVWL